MLPSDPTCSNNDLSVGPHKHDRRAAALAAAFAGYEAAPYPYAKSLDILLVTTGRFDIDLSN